jgi:hypothetical protein
VADEDKEIRNKSGVRRTAPSADVDSVSGQSKATNVDNQPLLANAVDAWFASKNAAPPLPMRGICLAKPVDLKRQVLKRLEPEGHLSLRKGEEKGEGLLMGEATSH